MQANAREGTGNNRHWFQYYFPPSGQACINRGFWAVWGWLRRGVGIFSRFTNLALIEFKVLIAYLVTGYVSRRRDGRYSAL
jgi:hypothetical protein